MSGHEPKRKTRAERQAIKKRRADRAAAAEEFNKTQEPLFERHLGYPNVIPMRESK